MKGGYPKIGGFKKHCFAVLAVSAVLVACAVLPFSSGVPAPVTAAGSIPDVSESLSLAGQGVVSPSAAAVDGGVAAEPGRLDAGGDAPGAAPAASTGGSGSQAAQPPAETTQTPEDQQPIPDPSSAGVDPRLDPPADLTAQFSYSGTRKTALSWRPASYLALGYWVLRWSSSDFEPMLSIFRQLAALDPSLQGLVGNLETEMARLSQGGYTYDERNAVLEDVEAAIDLLSAALVGTAGAENLVDEMVGLADVYWTWSTSYSDTSFSNNTYYLYIASANFFNGSTSPASNCEGVYTVYADSSNPARPTGLVATAYDPGVGLEWNSNTEVDLAGYNVYRRVGRTDVRLNNDLITTGAEFFHLTGEAGDTYCVRAVDLGGRQSSNASATAVLAPATVFGPDSESWSYEGIWARENYTDLPGGRVLRVAHDTEMSATVTFTGRRVRVYSARYSRCGTMHVYIDGKLRLDGELTGIFDLFYDGGYYPNTPDGQFIPPLWQQKAFEVTGLSQGQHTLTIKVSGIPGAGGDVFVNFDYAEVR